MTEASENDYVVRVRAQVMTRDEGTGGWLALGEGGLAEVMVGRKPRAPKPGDIPKSDSESAAAQPTDHSPPLSVSSGETPSRPPSAGVTSRPPSTVQPHLPLYDYYINGRRISDNTIVLECTIDKDFQYNKVMPTFHHWVTEHKRFGLTFQTAADARAFDKGVRIACDDIMQDENKKQKMKQDDLNDPNIALKLDGLGGAWTYKKLYPGPREEDEEQTIFECLNLPSESRSSSENSTASRVKRHPPETPILSAITLPHQHKESGFKPYGEGIEEKPDDSDTGCPYVHLSAVHDYSYTSIGVGSDKGSPHTKQPSLKQDSGSLKKQYSGPPPLPDKKRTETFQPRLKCMRCHEWYVESANRPGSCMYGPDCFNTCIECVTCFCCARGMVYHCMTGDEGNFGRNPCHCSSPDDGCEIPNPRCTKRWFGLTLLSIFVPCLCCYPPLRCVHRLARSAHVAGARHVPLHIVPQQRRK